MQKSRQKSPSRHHRTTLSGYVFATRKKLLSSNMSSTCPGNTANFGPLATEIGPVVWGHPCKFQRVSRLGSVTARHLVVGISQTSIAALNRGRHLRSAGRSSRWALAHILLQCSINVVPCDGAREPRTHRKAESAHSQCDALRCGAASSVSDYELSSDVRIDHRPILLLGLSFLR